MNYLSVCSGIEAATCAWQSLGWQAVAFSEIEKFPSEVLAARHPNVPNWGDMTKFEEWPDAAIDVLVGGTPCQSFSVAGLRRGLADPRGNLALTYLAIADRYRPRWLVWENVPGVLSADDGRAFGALLGGMEKLGYGWAYRTLDAQYFGVAQRRRRVFVVASLAGWAAAGSVLFEPESLRGNPAPRREKGQEVAGSAQASTGDVAHCLNAGGMGRQDYETETLIAECVTGDTTHALTAEGFDASEDGTGRGTPIFAFSCKDHGADAGDTSPTLRAMGHDGSHSNAGGQVAVAFHENQRAEITTNETAGAINVGGGKPGQGYPAVMQGTHVRRLTPVECERLQGFPDGYTDIVYRGKPAADGPRYKALGNSMAVPVMAWIGRRVDAVTIEGTA
ncbi:DNA cytosine methyltransferase [Salinisphaera sp. SPP-AMP-43]|uniref:DNA cytosine methyltransferase n=1 Tax=Salinisphaera sp. SPP-AMP-43 TaxID=3121288 RepID=UPI003C6DD78A